MTTADFIGEVKNCLIAEIKPWIEEQVNELYRSRISKATLSVEETAEYIGVSTSMIYMMAKEKRLPAIKVGASTSMKPTLRFRLSAIDKWMDEQEKQSLKGIKP